MLRDEENKKGMVKISPFKGLGALLYSIDVWGGRGPGGRRVTGQLVLQVSPTWIHITMHQIYLQGIKMSKSIEDIFYHVNNQDCLPAS